MDTHDINKMVGMKWKRFGRSADEGLDCWGFFKWFYKEKLNLIVALEYEIDPSDTKNVVKAFQNATERQYWKKVNEPQQYDAVALSMNKKIHHVGVWVNNGCLHAVESTGVVFNTLSDLKRNGFNKVEYYKCLAIQ